MCLNIHPVDPAEALGFTLRVVCKYEPDSTILFTIQQLFIVCSPAAFLAFNYVLYGRLISYVGAEHSIVKSQKIATIFVISDVSTFMMQVRINPSNGARACSGSPRDSPFDRPAEAVL